jgi:hypothetical protein
MRGRGFLRAVLVGALFAVLVLGIGGYALLRARTGEPLFARGGERGVVLALVLPDAAGDRAARVIVYYPPGAARGVVVDPLTASVVPGTAATTLGDAFTFGGGAALARAYAGLAGTATPSWVVVDETAWRRLASGGVSVRLPRPVDVFNGTELVSFPLGEVAVQANDVGTLLGGIDGLSASDRLTVLGDIAVTLQRSVASATSSDRIESDLSARQFQSWLSALAGRSMPQTSTP